MKNPVAILLIVLSVSALSILSIAQHVAVKIYSPLFNDGLIQSGHSITPHDSLTPGSICYKTSVLGPNLYSTYQIACGTENTKAGFRIYFVLYNNPHTGQSNMVMNVYNSSIGSQAFYSQYQPLKFSCDITDNNNGTVSGQFKGQLLAIWPVDTLMIGGYFKGVKY